MLAKEQEINRRIMMEKVIRIGKTVTEQAVDFRTTMFRIWDGVRNGFDFDRAAIFLYSPSDNMMWGSYGTNRSGEISEEWDMKFSIMAENSSFQTVLSQPDGYYFTQDYAGERNLSLRPGHPMGGVNYYAAVACWSGDKPVGIICVDQLISGRTITDEQLEALRLFAGYAGLAIENARLNAELEGRMQERENFIQELGSRNAELERFTYTVSHDLRSPLVTIKGFLGMLNRDILKDQKDKIASDMQRIAGAADKMGDLLSDLLELSRIGRIINPPEEIDLVKLAYETLETVDGRIRVKNITTHISADLPRIQGDRVRLGEVLENLLDNAAKYMGEQPNPHIEIGARIDQGEQVIYFKDNGMGIAPQYLQKVFGLFEKLNPTSEGTGIGLALIKRIIEVHGGRIWAESDGLGKGSTFCFTIPSAEKN
jgi:signal transduction histidine kinase